MAARQFVIAAIAALYLTGFANQHAAAAEMGRLVGATQYTIPGWFKDSFLEIREDAAEAADEDRHLLLFMHLNGCPYCAKVLKENFDGGPNHDFIRKNFDCVALNILGDREVVYDDELTLSEKELARQLKVFHTPAVLFLDKHGKLVARLNGYRNPDRFRTVLEYVQSESYKTQTLADYAARETNIYTLRPHPSFSGAVDLQAVATPLMVIFEDAACRGCDRFHDDYLNQPTVTRQLDKMTVVRLDAQSREPLVDPSGARTSAKAWARKLGLHYRPGIVFFDGDRELIRLEGMLNKYHFETTVIWVAQRQYRNQPDYRSFSQQRQEQMLKSGRSIDVSF